MYDGNQGEIDFGSSQREVRVIESRLLMDQRGMDQNRQLTRCFSSAIFAAILSSFNRPTLNMLNLLEMRVTSHLNQRLWSYLHLQVHSGQIPELYRRHLTRGDPGGLPFKRDGGLVVSLRGVNYRISVSFTYRNIFILKRNNKEISFNEINITVAVREPLSLVEKPTLTLFFIFFKVSLFSTVISFFFSYSVLLMLNY